MAEVKDKYDIHFEQMLMKLKDCQNSKNYKSCFNCEKFLECDTRDEYVTAAYEEMSKGKSGGFDF